MAVDMLDKQETVMVYVRISDGKVLGKARWPPCELTIERMQNDTCNNFRQDSGNAIL